MGPTSRYIPAFALAIGLAAFLGSYEIPRRVADLLIGLGFAVFLTSPHALALSLGRSLDRKLADFSYSLYVTHEPVLLFAVLIFVELGIMSLDGFLLSWTGLACFLATFAATLAVGYGFGRIFESRTGQLRKFLMSLLPQKPALAPAASPIGNARRRW
jgi:peptidoglycan/LPS O-acetylase OafA/YrhL